MVDMPENQTKPNQTEISFASKDFFSISGLHLLNQIKIDALVCFGLVGFMGYQPL